MDAVEKGDRLRVRPGKKAPVNGHGVFSLNARSGWSGPLAGHGQTNFSTLAATLDALVHVANLLATVRAGLADFCAGLAVMRMVITISAHEIDARRAGSNAVEHQLDMLLVNVVATFA